MKERKIAHYILRSIFLAVNLSSCILIDNFTGEGEAKRIRMVGYEAQAVVLDIWDTGITLNDNPIVGFKLRVIPPAGDPYEAETQGLISRLHIPQIQPGAVLTVAVDPADPTKIALSIYED